ncbi:MAG: tandem-95 repeat protein [Thermoplasmata archaeon]|nr:MAG: tandem-95 repeat protein [Thermoplasmata archaeon]
MRSIKLYLIIMMPVIFLMGAIVMFSADEVSAAGGSGTPEDPYIIENVNELQDMNLDLTAHYKLGNDIDASATSGWNSGAGFEPVGNTSSYFTGSFDGDNHTISGLYINRPSQDYVGLFGWVEGGELKNVIFKDAFVTGKDYVGTLSGINQVPGVKVSNCIVYGEVSSTGYYTGLLIGSHVGGVSGSVENCSVYGRIYCGENAGGGLIGYGDTIITNCFSYGTVTVSGLGGNVGGLVGRNNVNGVITNSYCDVETSGVRYVGGFVGVNSGVISNCYALGDVSGNDDIGGFVGYLEPGDIITNCYSTGNVTGNTNVGGFLGVNDTGIITNCSWDNETSGRTDGVGNQDPDPDDVIGRNTTDMMTQATFTSIEWDFTDTWFMVDGETRPFLRMEWRTEMRNSHELQLMLMNLSADYEVADDLNLTYIVDKAQMWGTNLSSGAGFVPIGNYSDRFTGTLEGNDYSIYNLYINRSSTDYIGLFGYTQNAEIKNVSLEGNNVTGNQYVGSLMGMNNGGLITNCIVNDSKASGDTYIGGLMGRNTGGGVVTNCTTSVNTTGTGQWTGGLIGHNNGEVTNCTSKGYTTGNNVVAGLIGQDGGGVVTNCTVYGDVYGSLNYVAGLIGYNIGGTITDCVSHGYTNGTGQFVGGLIGYNEIGAITNCIAYGNTTGYTNYVGGLIGENAGGTVTDCITYGNVNGTGAGSDYIGGMIGWNYGATSIANCSAHGNTTGNMRVGGLIGYNEGGGTLTNCTSHGNTNGNLRIGGLIGDNSDSIVTNSNAYGNTTGTDYIGGLFGSNSEFGTATNCTAHGNTTGTNDYIGGLIGENSGGTVSDCTAYGDVKGKGAGSDNVGGLIGWNNQEVTNCRAYGNTSGTGQYVGGLIGWNNQAVTNCTAHGDTSGTSDYVGGLIGSNMGTITSCHAYGNTTGGNNRISGLIGFNIGTITSCHAYGNTNGGNNRVGGLIGDNQGGTVTNCTTHGNTSGNDYIGGLVGYSNGGAITFCHAYGDTTGNSNIGGLIGRNYRNVANCTSYGKTAGNTQVGGLIGLNEDGPVTNCNSNGTTSGIWYVGGLVGQNSGYINYSSSSGSVIGTGGNIGGLVGRNFGFLIITNSYCDVDGAGVNNVGGLVGWNDAPITGSYATGKVTGSAYVGGLVGTNGWTAVSSITNSYSTGEVTGTSNIVGGLIGENTETISSVIHNCNSSSKVSGLGYVGGLVGRNYIPITDSHSTGLVNGTGDWVGGLVGYSGDNIENCFSTGSVEGMQHVGGLVGYLYSGGTVNLCNSSSSVNGTSNVGGLVGCVFGTSATVTNSYCTGNSTGNDHIGGLIGDNNGDVTKCTAFGYTYGITDYVGGLIGYNDGGIITDCHSLGNTIGNNRVGGLIGENHGDVTDCTTIGTTNGFGVYIGGLIGFNYGNVTKCTAYGNSLTDEWGPFGDNPPTGWTIIDNGDGPSVWDSNDWHRYLFDSSYPSGTDTYAARAYYLPHEVSDEWLITPVIDLTSGVYTDVSLQFQTYWYNPYPNNRARIHIRLDHGPWEPPLDTYTTTQSGDRIYFIPNAIGHQLEIGFNYLSPDADINGESMWFVDNVMVTSLHEILFFEDFGGPRDIGSTTGDSDVGGLIGYNNGGAITNCISYGDTIANGDYVGGLIGYNDGGEVLDCHAHGNVSGNNSVGGLIGENHGNVTYCTTYGNTSGLGMYIGGVIGFNNANVTNCIAYGDTNCGLWGPFGDNPPAGWTIIDNGDGPSVWNSNDWHRDFYSSAYPGGTNSYAARVYFFPLENQDEELITPSIDVSGYSSVTLEYDTYYDDYSLATVDYGDVDVSFDGGSWTTFYTYSQNDEGGHKSHIITIPPGTSTVQVRWRYRASNEWSWFIDNVEVSSGSDILFFEDFEGIGIKNATTGDSDVGGLIGYNNGATITDSISNGNTYGLRRHIGGLIGYNDGGAIKNCTTYGYTKGTNDYVGGMIGYTLGGTITDCKAYVNTNGRNRVGGLIGNNDGGTVDNCQSHGYTNGTDFVGGLIGYNNGVLVANCTTFGQTYGTNDYVGGLIGWNTGPVINSKTYGNTTGNHHHTGGLIGIHFSENVTNCSTYGNTTGANTFTGGLIGNNNDGEISGCNVYGNTGGSGNDYGGLIGRNNGPVKWCNVYGNVGENNNWVGGLIGHNLAPGTVENSTSFGKVKGNSHVGGLIGRNGGTVTSSFCKGDVNGNINVGGLIGINKDGTVKNCYAQGEVDGSLRVGGLIGNNSGNVTNCYSSGLVKGSTDVGGLVGFNFTGTTTNCFWDNKTSGWLTSDGGSARNTRNMMQKAIFSTVGWDFINIWGIVEANSYPYLKALETRPPATADINITIEDSVDPVLLGTTLIYYVNVTCYGPHNAGLVVATVSLPSEVNWVSDNRSLGPPDGNNNLTWVIGSVNNGETISCKIHVTVDTFGTGVITSDGLVFSVTFDPGAYANYTSEDTAVNRVPIAFDDINSTDEDTVLNVPGSGVLSNDNDPDPDTITVIAYDNPSTLGAVVIVNADGSYSYDPTGVIIFQALSAGENLVDSFNYTISDSLGGFAVGTVNITVYGANDLPSANDDSWETDEETILNIVAPGVLVNDSDIDANDILTIVDFDAVTTFGVSITLNANGSFSYDPTGLSIFQGLAVGESLVDSFNYTISDGNGGIVNATVSITVNGINDNPQANDDIWSTNANTTLVISVPGVLINDTDIDTNDVLTVIAYDNLSSLGVPVIVGVDGNFSYDPTGLSIFQVLTAGENLLDSFNYTITDGQGGTSNATVNITVNGVNDWPFANDDSWDTDEDTILNVIAPGLLANDFDVDTNDILTIIDFDATTKLGLSIIVNADGSFSYDPDGLSLFQTLAVGENLVDSFNYTVSDGNGGIVNATVNITVNGVNDNPLANDDEWATDEDTTLIISLPGVLVNDADTDTSDVITVTAYDNPSSLGASVTVNADGSFTYNPASSVTLQALASGESLVDSFTYTIDDGNGGTDTAMVNITVDGLNDNPIAYDDIWTTDEDTELIIASPGVLGNDIDTDMSDILTVTSYVDPSYLGATVTINSDGSFTYYPNSSMALQGLALGESLVDNINYTVGDGSGGVSYGFINITIIGVNDEPAISSSDVTTSIEDIQYINEYRAEDIDVGDELTWMLQTNANWLSIDTETGVIDGTPSEADVGSFWVNVTVRDDNGGLDYTNFTLEVLLDTDGDGTPDIIDDDDDGDTVPDVDDDLPLDPTESIDTDSDGIGNNADTDDDDDGMPDDWELANDLNPLVDDSQDDNDNDGLTNLEEYEAGSDPNSPEKAESEPSDEPFLFVIIVIIIIIVVLLLLFLLRKRGGEEEDEIYEEDVQVEGEPEDQEWIKELEEVAEEEAEDFECPECGETIHGSPASCPNCGTEFEYEDEEDTVEVFECPVCGSSLSPTETICPKCGSEIEVDEEE